MSDDDGGGGGWGGLVILIVLILLGNLGYGLYRFADSQGYINHTVETKISAQANWLVGESKDCTSFSLSEEGGAAAMIACDDGPLHDMKVTFYGRMLQPEHTIIYWRCTRNDETFSAEGFTCRQTGAG